VDTSRLVILIVQAIEIYSVIDRLVYPYARVFRNLVPPIGGFDFSIIVAFLALNLAQKLLASLI
jgi:YggT family protein